MRYTDIKDYKPSVFKRLTGVRRTTFDEMLKVVCEYKTLHRKHKSRGRPSKLSVADQLLMLLMYYREYRTFLHISVCYGISEMHCWRTITSIEQILLQSKSFHLPGKKALHNADNNFKVIVVDVSEHPIERPKKNSEKAIQAKRNDTR
jgi:hypothetical protein